MADSYCDACASTNVMRFVVRKDLAFLVCRSCGHCKQFIRTSNLTESFESIQRRYYGSETLVIHTSDSPFDHEILKTRARIFSRYVSSKSSIVEVGPGAGSFLNWLVIKGHRVLAVEQSPQLASHLVRRFSTPVINDEFEKASIGSGVADAFCSFHVIEHVAQPIEHLAKAYEVVRAGGYAFVATPNSRAWEQRLSGRLSPNYDSAHLRIFSPVSLRRVCESTGWTVVKVLTPEYTSGWLRVAAKLVRRARGEDEEETAGKYYGNSSRLFRGFAFLHAPSPRP